MRSFLKYSVILTVLCMLLCGCGCQQTPPAVEPEIVQPPVETPQPEPETQPEPVPVPEPEPQPEEKTGKTPDSPARIHKIMSMLANAAGKN